MSLESDRKLSLEELKKRNQTPPTMPSACPLTQQDVDELFERLTTLREQMKALYQQNYSLQTRISTLPAKTELEQISRSLSQIQQTLSQAGSRRGRSFSLLKLRFTTLEWTPLWLILPLALAALAVIWFSLGELWKGWATMLP